MTYQITASPIRGQKTIKNVEGVRELHTTLAELRGLGYEIKHISRPSRVLNLIRKLQAA
jgi:hypothetical protein